MLLLESWIWINDRNMGNRPMKRQAVINSKENENFPRKCMKY